jgi:hypothetical protein
VEVARDPTAYMPTSTVAAKPVVRSLAAENKLLISTPLHYLDPLELKEAE